MPKTLSVSAIENGTVIDHIHAGQAFRILQLLDLMDKSHQITVGLNLPSKRLKLKDLIKIENVTLTSQQANDIIIFAPHATINIIKQFEVAEKVDTTLPAQIANVFVCMNANCITHSEPVNSFFYIKEQGKQVKLICRFCENIANHNELKVKL